MFVKLVCGAGLSLGSASIVCANNYAWHMHGYPSLKVERKARVLPCAAVAAWSAIAVSVGRREQQHEQSRVRRVRRCVLRTTAREVAFLTLSRKCDPGKHPLKSTKDTTGQSGKRRSPHRSKLQISQHSGRCTRRTHPGKHQGRHDCVLQRSGSGREASTATPASLHLWLPSAASARAPMQTMLRN
jgi:hypothetical protein